MDCLAGLVVKVSASRTKDPGFDSRSRCADFCGSSHTSDKWLPYDDDDDDDDDDGDGDDDGDDDDVVIGWLLNVPATC